jgi:hypothetical protein
MTHGRMARGRHGLPQTLPRPAMPYPSMPCGRATHETALRPFQAVSGVTCPQLHGAGGLRPSSTRSDTPRRMPMVMTWSLFCPFCTNSLPTLILGLSRPVREGVSTDSLRFHAGPAMPNPYTPCGWATPQTAVALWPSSSPLDTPSRTSL